MHNSASKRRENLILLIGFVFRTEYSLGRPSQCFMLTHVTQSSCNVPESLYAGCITFWLAVRSDAPFDPVNSP